MEEILRIKDEKTKKALKYFGLDNHFTIEELEAAKYKMNKQYFPLFFNTEANYKKLLDYGMYSNKNFFAYRDEFIRSFQEKYNQLPSANNSQLLEKDLASIRKEISEFIKYASKESNEKNFEDGIKLFYEDYIKKGKRFISDYLVHNGEIRSIDLRNELQKSAIKMLLDMPLKELVQRLNAAIKINYKNQTKLQTLLNTEFLSKVESKYRKSKYSEMYNQHSDMIDYFISILKDKIKEKVAETTVLTNKDVHESFQQIVEDLNDELNEFNENLGFFVHDDVERQVKKSNNKEAKQALIDSFYDELSLEDYGKLYDMTKPKQPSNLPKR